MQLFVVPRSMPIVFAIPVLPSWVCVLRKSKPECINFPGLRYAVLALLLAASVVAAASGASGALLPVAAQPSVRLSTDRLTTLGAQHATQVEPHAVGVGSTI